MSQESEKLAVTPLEEQVLELLRTKGLSIKRLDEERKQKVQEFIRHWHLEKGVSLTDIAKQIGNKTSGYTSWLVRQLGIQSRDFEEARLAGIHKKIRKYERKPFDGTDEDKAYILGLRHGDLSAHTPFGDAVRVSTSTTHPALANLFTELFIPYGHIYMHPRYKKDTKTYEWNFHAILDKSFGFLLDGRDVCREWIASKDSTMLSYLAGVMDAEGSIGIERNARTTSMKTIFYNTDTGLLQFVRKCLTELGCKPGPLYLDKDAGAESGKYHIIRRHDYYRVMVAIFEDSQSLLRRLPLRHQEKVERKELALSIAKGERWDNIKSKVWALAGSFEQQRIQFTRQAEIEFLQHHPEP